jgi:hypothetical protein
LAPPSRFKFIVDKLGLGRKLGLVVIGMSSLYILRRDVGGASCGHDQR